MQKYTPTSQNEMKTAPFAEDRNLHGYFMTLPPAVQESMVQSGLQVSTLAELQQCADHYMKREQ